MFHFFFNSLFFFSQNISTPNLKYSICFYKDNKMCQLWNMAKVKTEVWIIKAEINYQFNTERTKFNY